MKSNLDVPRKQPSTDYHCQHYRGTRKNTPSATGCSFSQKVNPAVAQIIAELVADGITDVVDVKRHYTTASPTTFAKIPHQIQMIEATFLCIMI